MAWPSGQRVGLKILIFTVSIQRLSGASRCYLEQESLLSLLSTAWFQGLIRGCSNKLAYSYQHNRTKFLYKLR
jgi:hypothetical protein